MPSTSRRALRQAHLSDEGDRRGVLPPDHLHRLPDVLLGAAPRPDLGQGGQPPGRRRQAAGPGPQGDGVGPRLDHRARQLHVRHQRRDANAQPSAGPTPGRDRVRSAVAALRQLQAARQLHGPGLDRQRRPARRSRRPVPARGRRQPRSLRAAAPGRGAGRGRAVHLPERDADEPDHDGQPAPADPHVGAAPVHHGAVGDPPAVQADPPRDLRRQPLLRQLPRPEVRAARLLRRDGQPRRALPHQAAPRHGDGRVGGLPRRLAGGDRWAGRAGVQPLPSANTTRAAARCRRGGSSRR